MTGKNNTINYVEFNVSDITASKTFYGSAFGWTFTDYGPQYCEFSDGSMTGGFTTTAPVTPQGGALVILFANDLQATLEAVKNASGTIVQDIFEFPGGRRFHFKDTDGYELAVWSDK